MSYMKNAYLDLSEELGVSPAQLQEEFNSTDAEWTEHTTLHNGHPSANCVYCVEKADEPVEQEVEEYA